MPLSLSSPRRMRCPFHVRQWLPERDDSLSIDLFDGSKIAIAYFAEEPESTLGLLRTRPWDWAARGSPHEGLAPLRPSAWQRSVACVRRIPEGQLFM